MLYLLNLGTLTRGEMAAKVPDEIKFWMKLYIDNTDQKKMPKAAALKSLENGAGADTRRCTLSHLIRTTLTLPQFTDPPARSVQISTHRSHSLPSGHFFH